MAGKFKVGDVVRFIGRQSYDDYAKPGVDYWVMRIQDDDLLVISHSPRIDIEASGTKLGQDYVFIEDSSLVHSKIAQTELWKALE